MGLPIFPQFRYANWAVHKVQNWSTIQNKSTSGGQLSIPLWPNNPLWSWEWSYEVVLDDLRKLSFKTAPNNNVLYTDLQILEAFYFQQRGGADTFLHLPPDSAQVDVLLAAPDVNNNVELRHVIGAVPDPAAGLTIITEAVQELNNANVTVKVGGSPASGWTLKQPGTVPPYEGLVINFSAPPNSNVITSSFNYYYRCTFEEDAQDYEQFALLLWSLRSVKYNQVRVTIN